MDAISKVLELAAKDTELGRIISAINEAYRQEGEAIETIRDGER